MSAPHADQLVGDYLGRLDSALAGLPKSRREEILDEITNHIAEERSRLHDESDADVRNLLDRVGDPVEVADAARDENDEPRLPLPNRRIGPVEVLALVLTPLFWPAGVILLWLSPAWNLRDRLIGSLLPPGGYIFIFFFLPLLMIGSLQPSGGCMTVSDAQGNVIQHSCTGFEALPGWQQFAIQAAGIGLFLLLLVLPVLTAIYLTYRARKWSTEPAV
jgi:uncharacterized membrane protein